MLAVPCLVYAMDLTVLNLALPAISADLHPSGAQQLWIVDIYGFMVAGALITMGALGDRIGGRRLLMIGAAAFAGASVLAAFATERRAADRRPRAARARRRDGRAVDAVADQRAVPRPAPAHGRDRRLGGELLASARRSARWPAAPCSSTSGGARCSCSRVPAMAMLLLLGPRLLPERRDAGGGRLDIGSAALSSAAVLSAVYGLKQLATGGGAEAPLGSLAGLALGVLFVRRQRRSPTR